MKYIAQSLAIAIVSLSVASPVSAVTVTGIPDSPPGGPWSFTASSNVLTFTIAGLPWVACQATIDGEVDSSGAISNISIEIFPGDVACYGISVSTAGTGQFVNPEVVHIYETQLQSTLGECGLPSTLVLGWDGASAFVIDGAVLPYQSAPQFECQFWGDDFYDSNQGFDVQS